jgi:hypothetical protein
LLSFDWNEYFYEFKKIGWYSTLGNDVKQRACNKTQFTNRKDLSFGCTGNAFLKWLRALVFQK